jgi:hypothetical protein
LDWLGRAVNEETNTPALLHFATGSCCPSGLMATTPIGFCRRVERFWRGA